MMIDRMFLAEEQQSLLKAQSDLKIQNELDMQQSIETTLQEMYSDDIKQEIPSEIPNNSKIEEKNYELPKSEEYTVKTEDKNEFDENPDFNIKCGLNYFSDGSCDSNFQVYEENPKFEDFIKEDFNSEKTKESYNTTKIIGNFEIEINNKGCNQQESYTKNFRQKIIDTEKKKNEDIFNEKPSEQTDEQYDEWLCIQRELGYFPETKEEPKTVEETPKIDTELFKKSQKRTSSDTSRLETLKKFRVEKHNSKKKIIGEVKFEVRIEHKKVFPEKKDEKNNKRNYDNAKDEYGKRMCVNQNFGYNIKEETNTEDNFETSIDEQVQSAIDSILNLQQISNSEKGECSKTEFSNKEEPEGLDDEVKNILS